MRYLSVCSGIEAATVAWRPFGWEAAGFSEIKAFPSAVLAHHYPGVTNFGDMPNYKEWDLGAGLDVLVGGTPCQSFSVAGLRAGLDDPRGNLALVYLGIAAHFRPRWLVWENVPGVLSADDGRAFGAFLGGLAELGYGFAYRVLDAQHFGVAQRRRRVFVVGHLGGTGNRAAAVLIERGGLRGDPPPHRVAGDEDPARSPGGTGEAGGGSVPAAIGFGHQEGRNFRSTVESISPLTTSQGVATLHGDRLGRLTPTECARLQQFPDEYLDIEFNGKPATDTAKYMALGNSMAVPVMRWIGKQIEVVDQIPDA